MAGTTPEFSFVSRWYSLLDERFGKNSTRKMLVPFSERLLNVLYYETDIGSIPRGAETRNVPTINYMNSSNWKNDIKGCYWCNEDYTSVQGICCSYFCLLCFHEWCITCVEWFRLGRFCNYPGCDGFPSKPEHFFCVFSHKEQYSKEYLSYWSVSTNDLRREVYRGPHWYYYNSHTTAHNYKSHPASNVLSPHYERPTGSSTFHPDFSRANMCLAHELSAALFFYTDVGPIPRSFKISGYSSSQFSTHKNWNKAIEGCYRCGKSTTNNEYLCSGKCYVIFHEWCRLKVSTNNGKKFCQQPGCKEISSESSSACSKEHLKMVQDNLNNYKLTSSELDKLVAEGPCWYEHTQTHNTKSTPTPDPPRTETPRDFYLFSQTLTEWMYKESDIGPIPRSLLSRFPSLHSINTHNSPNNWDIDIPMCYWCCSTNPSIHDIACSDKCFFLLNEWIHKKHYQSAKTRLCKYPPCNSTTILNRDCCFGDSHTDKYRQKYCTKYSSFLRSTEYVLGPKWYSDKSIRSIDFYNREDPFYEFTNFYPCHRLKIDGSDWATTEHYFQAQKFVGTPHVEFVRKMKTPREAFDYTRGPGTMKWIRPDWQMVKESVMLKVLEEKFNQNEALAHVLIQTGDAQLYEHTWKDKYWGDGGDRKGKNILGKLLMQVRFDLYKKCPYLPSRLEHLTASVSSDLPPKSPPSNPIKSSKPDDVSGNFGTSNITCNSSQVVLKNESSCDTNPSVKSLSTPNIRDESDLPNDCPGNDITDDRVVTKQPTVDKLNGDNSTNDNKQTFLFRLVEPNTDKLDISTSNACNNLSGHNHSPTIQPSTNKCNSSTNAPSHPLGSRQVATSTQTDNNTSSNKPIDNLCVSRGTHQFNPPSK